MDLDLRHAQHARIREPNLQTAIVNVVVSMRGSANPTCIQQATITFCMAFTTRISMRFGFSYKQRKIFKMLWKLMLLCKLMGAPLYEPNLCKQRHGTATTFHIIIRWFLIHIAYNIGKGVKLKLLCELMGAPLYLTRTWTTCANKGIKRPDVNAIYDHM